MDNSGGSAGAYFDGARWSLRGSGAETLGGSWVRLAEERWAESGGVVLSLRGERGQGRTTGTVLDRLRLAAEWAVDLDAQYAELLKKGRNPLVTVPSGGDGAPARVDRETIDAYRRLQLGVGALIFPVLRERPHLDDLYPFQRTGTEWLVDKAECILADDMGLGKTVQVIAALRLLFNRGHVRTAIVVCPKSLTGTWERECARWAPELGVGVLTPPAAIREEAWRVLVRHRHVLVTNYEQFRRPPAVLLEKPPDVVVADEAHRLRNYGSQTTYGCFQLRPKRFWALTGTPLERDAQDLATLLSLVAPTKFAPTDAKTLHATSLRARAAPYVLRRRKADVLNDLPDVLDTVESLELTEAQARSQQEAVRRYRLQGGPGDELALLTRLQTICDIDPGTRESCKLDRILYTLGRVREQEERAVVFSHRLEPLRELERRIAERWGRQAVELLVGDMDGHARERAVGRFRGDERCLALLASSRVGGEGLTLVEANHVFLVNQWWNPSANDQARDRVVRIGQQRKVRVYRYCCRGTVEEALEKILQSKRELVDDIVERFAAGDDGAWSTIVREVGIDRLVPSGATE